LCSLWWRSLERTSSWDRSSTLQQDQSRRPADNNCHSQSCKTSLACS
jgi:hypothetical protein